jgi:hypothetical protein
MLITSEDGNNTRVHIHGCSRKAKKEHKRISSASFYSFKYVHMLYVANTRIYTKELIPK